jgi:hypothetical protein
LFVEKITRKEGHVSYIATSFSQTNQKAKNYLLACDISIHFGVTRLTFFYQSEKNILNMNVPTILSSTVTDFINLELFAWISYCDKEIDIKNFVLKDKKLELCYGFSSNHKNNVTTQPLLIQPTSNLNIRRPRSGSWGIDLNAKSDSTLQKNKFPSTSILLSSSTPQVIPTSSYTEGQLDKCPSNEQRTNDTANEESEATESIITIEAQSQPSISIDLPDHKEWISKFAQLCVRLYQKSNGLYIIKMIHPSTLLEYLTNDNIQMEDNIIRVKMEIKESILGTCCVNENNWPITSWNPQTVTNPIDDPSTSETDDNDDIFVNQMEELGTESPIIKSQPIKSPTSLSLTPIENRQQQPQQQLMKELAKLPHVQKQPIKEINTSSTVPFVQKQVLKETSSSSLILEQKKQLPIKE